MWRTVFLVMFRKRMLDKDVTIPMIPGERVFDFRRNNQICTGEGRYFGSSANTCFTVWHITHTGVVDPCWREGNETRTRVQSLTRRCRHHGSSDFLMFVVCNIYCSESDSFAKSDVCVIYIYICINICTNILSSDAMICYCSWRFVRGVLIIWLT